MLPRDPRFATLRAALGFLQLPPRAPELQLVHRWLDSWTGVGLIAVGLHRQSCDLQLTQYGDGNWRDLLRHRRGALHRGWLGVEADAVARGAARGEGDVEDDMTPPRRAFPSVAVLLVMSGAAEFPSWVITNQDRDRVAGR